jgi:pSer/pThr/pTyr-binding forkhead associated (FHA) protein
MHKLTIEDDEGKTVVVPLVRDEITVGRQEGNTIRLTERNISRRHARLRRQNGLVLVEDLSSYNGVRVNGARISGSTALKDGDVVVVGDYRLTIRSDRAQASASPTILAPGGGPFAPVPPTAPAIPAVAPTALAPSVGTAPLHGASPVTPPLQPIAPPGLARQPLPLASSPAQPATFAAPGGTAVPPGEGQMEGAPTMPVRTLADQGLASAAAPALPGRLVVISSNFAGAEFTLDRPSMVIGRTPENDIVLNHKSISRHHAKVVREGDKFVVVDLESANGVRVNGTEFERVDLSSGDVLELGHVRLRFVTGDDPVDYDAGGGFDRKKAVIAGGVVGAGALGVVLLLVFTGGKKQPEPAAQPQAAAPPAAAPATAPPPSEPPTPAAAPPSPKAPSEPASALLEKAKTAAQAERWPEALEAVNGALAAEPGAAAASELKQGIEAEKQNADRFAALKAAVAGQRYDEALGAFAEIPESSVYRKRAAPLQRDAFTRAVAMHLQAAQKLRSSGSCAEAQREAEAVLALDARHPAARQILDGCAKLAAKAAAPREAPQAPAPKPAGPKPAARPVALARAAPVKPAPAATKAPLTPASEPAPTGDPDALVKEAQQGWVKGQYAAAIEAARKALRIKPNMMTAYQIIAVCSCSLRDADGAKRAYERLDDRTRGMVRTMCQKSGVALE